MNRIDKFAAGMSEESADILAAREAVWRKLNKGVDLTDEEKALVGLEDDSWCPEVNQMERHEKRIAAEAYQASHLNPKEFPTRTDLAKERERYLPEWRLFGMKQLIGRRILRRTSQEHLSLFNEAFLEKPELFRKYMRGQTMAVFMARLVDIDPDLPVFVIMAGDFESGLSLEMTTAGRLHKDDWPVEMSSLALHKDHVPSGKEREKQEFTRRNPFVAGLRIPPDLSDRSYEIGMSVLKPLKVDIDKVKDRLNETDQSADGIIVGEFRQEWTRTVI